MDSQLNVSDSEMEIKQRTQALHSRQTNMTRNKNKRAEKQRRVRHFIARDYSEEEVAKVRSKLRTLTRCQLELLVCILGGELTKRDNINQKIHPLKGCPFCKHILSGNGLHQTTTVNPNTSTTAALKQEKGTDLIDCSENSCFVPTDYEIIETMLHKSNTDALSSYSLEYLPKNHSREKQICRLKWKAHDHLQEEGEVKEVLDSSEETSANAGAGIASCMSSSITLTAEEAYKNLRNHRKTKNKHDLHSHTKCKNNPSRSDDQYLDFKSSMAQHGLLLVEDSQNGKLDVINLYSGQTVFQKPETCVRRTTSECAERAACDWDQEEEGELLLSHKDVSEVSDKAINTPRDLLPLISQTDVECSAGKEQLSADDISKSHPHTLYKCPQTKKNKPRPKFRQKAGGGARGAGILKSFQCRHCLSCFKANSSLQRHIKSLHNKEKFTCVICSKIFNYKQTLKIHLNNKHNRHSVLCSFCGKLVLQANLRTHVKKVHEKPNFLCSICQKGFIKRECFEGHMNKHNNSKPYKCEYCGRKYVYSTSLHHHLKLCKKACIPKYLLTEGSTDDFKFLVCEMCGQRFDCPSSLRDHRSAKHSSKLYHCQFCGKAFQWRPSHCRHVKKCGMKSESERLESLNARARHSLAGDRNSVFLCVCGKEYQYRQSFQRHQKKCQHKLNIDSLLGAGSL